MLARGRCLNVVATAAALTGSCNQFFDIEPTSLSPEAADPDTDGDAFVDSVDNCPALANSTQADADGDTLGDVCDNCPLVSNAEQVDGGDGDNVGDACDPHPTQRGDCLILLDTFHDPAAFDQHWELRREAGDTTSSVTVGDRSIQLVPAATQTLALVPQLAGLVGLPVDLQLRGRGRVETAMTYFAVASHITTLPRTGYWCGLAQDAQSKPTLTYSFYPNSGTATAALSTEPVGDEFVFRLAVADPSFTTVPSRCQIDYGSADAANVTLFPELPPGTPGVVATGNDVEVTGFAVYRFDPTAACPALTIR